MGESLTVEDVIPFDRGRPGAAEAIDARFRARRRAKMAPSRTKQNQVKPSKIAWISLVLFVRIWTFQWVTAEKNKKEFLTPFCFPPGVSQDAGSIRRGVQYNADF
jgi:hypothetical protein